jgi:hypothetical protein
MTVQRDSTHAMRGLSPPDGQTLTAQVSAPE